MAQKSMIEKLIPEVDFIVSASGITVICERLHNGRFIPFDAVGKCQNCKSDQLEIDFGISREGVTIICGRMKAPKFVEFDKKWSLPNYCVFRVKSKGRVFNIPYYAEQQISEASGEAQGNLPIKSESNDNPDFQKDFSTLLAELGKSAGNSTTQEE